MDRALRHAVRDTALASLARDAGHDLRGALNVMLVNSEVLSRAAIDPASIPPEHVRRSAAALQRELGRIHRLAEVLLGSRAADMPSPESVDLVALLDGVLPLVAARAANQHVDLAFTGPNPVRVMGFPGQLQTVLLALLVNALDAMPQGGRLEVVVSSAPHPEVSVADTGSGIPADRLDAIWDLYFSTKDDGIGLGLPIARRIVERHGGRLRFEARSSGGSRFVVQFVDSASS